MNNLLVQGAALTVAAGAAYLVYRVLAPADKMGCLESKPEAEGPPVRRFLARLLRFSPE